MKIGKILFVLFLATAFVGCDKKADKPAPDRSPNRPSVPATPIEDSEPELERVQEAEISALLEKWLVSQNEGDFATYISLYADEMIGIKRVGETKTEFDRGGWERDRERMFDKTMNVSMSSDEIRIGEHIAVVDFVQTFESGKFEDTGPKRLVIENTDSGPRIIREEMLQSLVRNEEIRPHVIQAGQVVADRYVVLSTETDDSWEKGEARVAHGILAFKSVDVTKLPDTFQRYRGAGFEVQTPQGTTCERKASSLRVIARADLPTGEKALILSKRPKKGASELYEMAGDQGKMLVAELDEPCVGGVFATAAAGAVDHAAPFEQVEEIPESVLVDFRSDPEWQKIQKEYEATGQDGFWDQGPQAWMAELAEEQFMVVQAEAGPGCGEFRAELFALYALDGDEPETTQLTVGEVSTGIFRPVMAAKFSNSKAPIFYSREKTLAPKGDKWFIIQDLTPPSYICPC